MAFLGPSIRSILLANPTLTSIIGTRIFPQKLPLNCAWPSLSYYFPSDPFQRVVRGARLQMDCWAETYTTCHELSDLVETTLNSFSGTSEGIEITGIYPESPYDLYDDEIGIYHIAYDFIVIYKT